MEDDCAARLTDVIVTDHAVLRYLERAHGLNVQYLRDHIALLTATGAKVGATGVVIEGVKFVLQGKTVVTVLDRGWHSRDLRTKHGGET